MAFENGTGAAALRPWGAPGLHFQREPFAVGDPRESSPHPSMSFPRMPSPESMHNLSAQPWQMKMANLTYDNFTNGNRSAVVMQHPSNQYKTVELVFIATVTGSLSLVTVVGNILVMLSIKVNRQLQTVNNYFLFSLACADLIIGVFSMNLYTVYIIKGYWPLGAVVCDLWLALDYVVSNASVMNLLIISFDRYFCVTKPLTYPARRTTKMAGLMIAAAWILSFVLWAPAILFWQFIVGKRTVPERECYIQFLSNPAVTFGTAIAAFYLPVVIMTVLYIHISLASRSRVRRHKPEGKKEKKTKPLSFFKSPLIKQNNNSSPKRALEVKEEVRNGKLEDQPLAQTEAAGQQEEKETSNESSTVSITQTTKEKQVTEILPAGQGRSPAHPRVNSTSKWSKIKIVTKQTGTECVTAIEIVPAKTAASAQNTLSNNRPANVARKFASIARSQVRKKRQMAAREKKVTRTIFAILLAFILTWTPYNVMVLINTFCETCVPETVWSIGYWLCYVNSTINPACYALCNATFKKTFKHLLMCQYRNIGTAR
ncbi:muscarinic acetylcholine receptor M4 isoform X1 [Dermochelys coriacea]|uniref:muscarinic acetylcholine receptor M4 isoform X1 n=2 Tax=Dermochelys coriacea TaxID=27794 RepID=UPI0018E74410|nr:muscarinic acetylcholine receptor M4 isoform X1 [Dermochelys coriacea]